MRLRRIGIVMAGLVLILGGAELSFGWPLVCVPANSTFTFIAFFHTDNEIATLVIDTRNGKRIHAFNNSYTHTGGADRTIWDGGTYEQRYRVTEGTCFRIETYYRTGDKGIWKSTTSYETRDSVPSLPGRRSRQVTAIGFADADDYDYDDAVFEYEIQPLQ